MPSLCQQGVILIRHARLPAWQRERWQQLHQHRAVDRHADLMVQDEGKAGLGSPPRPADNNSASRQSRRFDSVIQCFAFLQLYCRMLLWEYLWWTDFRVPLDHWESSPEATVRMTNWSPCWTGCCTAVSVQERIQAADETMLKIVQGVHDKARPAKIERT